MPIYRLGDATPDIAQATFVAPTATLIGQVTLMPGVTVWFGAILRGDNEPIVIGPDSNIQEGVVLHTDPGYPLRLGRGVTVGHQAMLHGCTLEDNVLIGIQALVMNGAVIGRDSLVGAGAIVTERKVFPPRSLILGTPAKVVRELGDEDVARVAKAAADYRARGERYRATLVPAG